LPTSDCALAVSLNAVTDKVRTKLCVNRKYNLMDSFTFCVQEELVTQARRKCILSIYALENVNDSTDDVRPLVDFVDGIILCI